ncbi:glutathione peroxidase [Hydrobacter penzbergensis]|uniref:Glutathione peroxidase n=1 Tax=Hydrobacter penzbergensis TaxID=1235997 RepID=A0A8X8IJQ2_9BACT|nr:glutathione peroxidase [Hydrobacter penzbergensis]SDX48445.1 glutathione peroxidase [Hydrobacter penzbergensis]
MKKLIIILVILAVVLLLIKRKDMSWRQSVMKTFYPLIMLRGKLMGKGQILRNRAGVQPPVSFYSLQMVANNGSLITFDSFKGKKVLLVNTASDCGYTGQYEELENLHRQYGEQLVVLGFPANDFKHQETKDDAAIAAFCKINYGVSFPLMKKSMVIKGSEQNEVFNWLSDSTRNGWCNQAPVWNFCKYIIDENGTLLAFFPNTVSPLSKEVLTVLK